MKKVICVLSGLALIAAVGATTNDVGADEPSNWALTNCAGGKVKSGVACDLKNVRNQKCLLPKHNIGQTEWDFGACGESKAKIFSKNGGDILCGEPVALKLGGEFYRKCVNPQTVGINICSDGGDKPGPQHFTWKLTGCKDGEPVAPGAAVALFNTERGDSVVYASRASRIVDTCWADKVKLGRCDHIPRDQ
jgi:hypothetical protein